MWSVSSQISLMFSIWKTNLFDLDVVDVINRKVLWIFEEVVVSS